MVKYDLTKFLSECEEICALEKNPSEIVIKISPLLQRLITEDTSFLKEEQLKSNKEHYARHEVYCNADESLSLFTMVWSPGQWTPIHDHATWGVVGIVDGVLEEYAFVRNDKKGSEKISLERSGNVMLSKNSVISFVPNPDHIHQTGVAKNNKKTISLHLYGRAMNDYYKYDLKKGTREKMILD